MRQFIKAAWARNRQTKYVLKHILSRSSMSGSSKSKWYLKHQFRFILGMGLCSLIWWVLSRSVTHRSGSYAIASVSLPSLDFLNSTPTRNAEYYASDSLYKFRTTHRYPVLIPYSIPTKRKVYNLVIVNTKLSLLKIHLYIVYNYINYFIIINLLYIYFISFTNYII